jgi:hypothetical protein
MSLRSGPPSASIAPLAGLVLCLALWPSTTHAQYIGIKGGLSVANVNVTGRPHLPAELQWCCSPWDGTRLDPAVGVMAGVTIRPSIELTMETLLTQRGFSIDRTDADPGSQLRMSYIELAVLGHVVERRIRMFAGPSLGLNHTTRMLSQDPTRVLDYLDRSSLSRFDIGLVVGAGVDVNRLMVDVRYVHWFRNVLRHAPSGASLRHKTFILMFGVRVAGDSPRGSGVLPQT